MNTKTIELIAPDHQNHTPKVSVGICKKEFEDLRDFSQEYFGDLRFCERNRDKEVKVPIESFQDWALAYTAWASTIVADTSSKGCSCFSIWGLLFVLPGTIPL